VITPTSATASSPWPTRCPAREPRREVATDISSISAAARQRNDPTDFASTSPITPKTPIAIRAAGSVVPTPSRAPRTATAATRPSAFGSSRPPKRWTSGSPTVTASPIANRTATTDAIRIQRTSSTTSRSERITIAASHASDAVWISRSDELRAVPKSPGSTAWTASVAAAM
jgi:hypothetical protein